MKTRIREFRQARKLTLEQLAGRIGMSTGNLSRLERGHIPYDQTTLESLARELGCRPAELIEVAPPASPRDKALLDILHSLSEEEQERFLKMAKVYAEPLASPASSEDVEYPHSGFRDPPTLHEEQEEYRAGKAVR